MGRNGVLGDVKLPEPCAGEHDGNGKALANPPRRNLATPSCLVCSRPPDTSQNCELLDREGLAAQKATLIPLAVLILKIARAVARVDDPSEIRGPRQPT